MMFTDIILIMFQEETILSEVKKILGDDKLDGVICVAGGWAGGNSARKDFVKKHDIILFFFYFIYRSII